MHSDDGILCLIYMAQIVIGVFGNGLLFYIYTSNIISPQRIKSIYVIFINLAFSNIVMIFSRGLPWAIHYCIKKIFLSDIGCKIIVYLQRVSRGISLCITCLMSVFQAITISSGGPILAELKVRAQKCIVPSCVFIWVLNLLIDGVVPLLVTGIRNNTNSNLNRNIGLCSIEKYAMTTLKLLIWKSLYDTVFVGLMAITTGYMVLILYRHHCQVKHIHNTSLAPSSSTETRATKVIIFLMSIFVCSYSVSSIFVIVMDNSKNINPRMLHISVVFASFYPTISPFLLISSYSQSPNFFKAFKKMKMSYHRGLRTK
ncbi:vomeronasal type-1 receptor 4-like [Dromiciops gliroides]|uniref:vomeronasal type-1 receptor 4-like n=1 Tax=Dromiciops gliroides TaxID=33562 RepID=UPI001CC470F8|nr:vomeronasal type-1 receptor 4-like [Dromiciops gliroides]